MTIVGIFFFSIKKKIIFLAQSPIWLNRNAIDFAIKTPMRIASGDSLVLKCPASGNPLPQIYWSKNGVNINIGN